MNIFYFIFGGFIGIIVFSVVLMIVSMILEDWHDKQHKINK